MTTPRFPKSNDKQAVQQPCSLSMTAFLFPQSSAQRTFLEYLVFTIVMGATAYCVLAVVWELQESVKYYLASCKTRFGAAAIAKSRQEAIDTATSDMVSRARAARHRLQSDI